MDNTEMMKVWKEAERQRSNDLTWLLSDPRGRRVFQRFMDVLYEAGDERPEFHAGRRSVVLGFRTEALAENLDMVSLAHSEALAEAERMRQRIAFAQDADKQERDKL